MTQIQPDFAAIDIDPSILLRESWDGKAANPFHSLAALQKLAHHDSS